MREQLFRFWVSSHRRTILLRWWNNSNHAREKLKPERYYGKIDGRTTKRAKDRAKIRPPTDLADARSLCKVDTLHVLMLDPIQSTSGLLYEPTSFSALRHRISLIKPTTASKSELISPTV